MGSFSKIGDARSGRAPWIDVKDASWRRKIQTPLSRALRQMRLGNPQWSYKDYSTTRPPHDPEGVSLLRWCPLACHGSGGPLMFFVLMKTSHAPLIQMVRNIERRAFCYLEFGRFFNHMCSRRQSVLATIGFY